MCVQELKNQLLLYSVYLQTFNRNINFLFTNAVKQNKISKYPPTLQNTDFHYKNAPVCTSSNFQLHKILIGRHSVNQ